MVYICQFEHTNVNSRIFIELISRAKKAAKWASKPKQNLTNLSIEMQMVPKYLKLAVYNGQDRFNDMEISEITGLMKMYKSIIPADDLVKQLLNIGLGKGNPLSAGEIKDFLSATALMNTEEQNKVIKFITALKENVPNSANDNRAGVNERGDDLIKYKEYTSRYSAKSDNVSSYINLNNIKFAYGVAKCKKPEILAKIVQITGANSEIADAPDLYVQFYELSNGNLDLVQDLKRCFYLSELEQIVQKLTKHSNRDLSKYTSRTYSTDYHDYTCDSPGLELQRERVLQGIGLTGEIDLCELDSKSVSVKTIAGSFEQGKRH